MRIVYFSDVHIEIRESQPAAPWSDTLPLGFGSRIVDVRWGRRRICWILAGDIGRVHSTRNVSPLSTRAKPPTFSGAMSSWCPETTNIIAAAFERIAPHCFRCGRSDGDGARQGRGIDRTRRRAAADSRGHAVDGLRRRRRSRVAAMTAAERENLRPSPDPPQRGLGLFLPRRCPWRSIGSRGRGSCGSSPSRQTGRRSSFPRASRAALRRSSSRPRAQ